MSGDSGKPETTIPRSAVVMVIVLLLVPGGVFLAKGAVEVADRFAAREPAEATLLSTAVEEATTNRGSIVHRYEVRGVTAAGDPFEFEDRDVYDLADGRTPLPVRIERSALTGRILSVRTDTGTVEGVGGAGRLWLALLGLGLGGAFAFLPFRLPWHSKARNAARDSGGPVPAPDWGAFALVTAAAVVVVGGTLLWDLARPR